MTADAEAFHVETQLDVYERAEHVFSRSWTHRFPRDHV
jgi:hypothetical protein